MLSERAIEPPPARPGRRIELRFVRGVRARLVRERDREAAAVGRNAEGGLLASIPAAEHQAQIPGAVRFRRVGGIQDPGHLERRVFARVPPGERRVRRRLERDGFPVEEVDS